MSDHIVSDHIVVVGLMASGKTTIGAAVAAALGRPHRDSDADLATATGRTAREIAAERGIETLHALELRHLLDTLARPEPAVISAAASTIDEPAGRAALADPAVTVVWLRVDPAAASARQAADDHRPLPESIAVQAERRDPLFAALADVVVDARRPVDEIFATVLAAL